jgi:hypothetical protein
VLRDEFIAAFVDEAQVLVHPGGPGFAGDEPVGGVKAAEAVTGFPTEHDLAKAFLLRGGRRLGRLMAEGKPRGEQKARIEQSSFHR